MIIIYKKEARQRRYDDTHTTRRGERVTCLAAAGFDLSVVAPSSVSGRDQSIEARRGRGAWLGFRAHMQRVSTTTRRSRSPNFQTKFNVRHCACVMIFDFVCMRTTNRATNHQPHPDCLYTHRHTRTQHHVQPGAAHERYANAVKGNRRGSIFDVDQARFERRADVSVCGLP